MSTAVQTMLDVLNIEQLEVNLFRGRSPQDRWQRVFGGQVIGQALVAASRTVEGRPPHSLHAYFLIGGDPKVPIIYEVDRIRDGKSFTTRRVVAIQHGQAIFTLMVSFHNDEPGLEHQVPMPEVPPPEDLPSEAQIRATVLPLDARGGAALLQERAADRAAPGASTTAISARRSRDGKFNVWIRTTGKLPDDPAIHQCVLAYASDMSLLDTALVPHGRSLFEKEFMGASLDHALWLHRPFRADDWLLYAQESPNMIGSRGFARGLIFRRDGALVASVAQEGLVRIRRKES